MTSLVAAALTFFLLHRVVSGGPLRAPLTAAIGDDAAMAAFPDPAFALREVTDDPRYTGGALVLHGAPDGT